MSFILTTEVSTRIQCECSNVNLITSVQSGPRFSNCTELLQIPDGGAADGQVVFRKNGVTVVELRKAAQCELQDP